MRLRLFSYVALGIAALLAAAAACGEEPPAPRGPAPPSVAKSVTIFPIVLNSGAPIAGVSADMSKKMAELIGLFLERGGMKQIEIADARFIPSEQADLAKAAEAFGRFVQSQSLRTEYALYGQFIGTPGRGVDEIRLAVVDRQGKVVLADRLDRQQLLLKRLLSGEDKVCPMSACYCAFGQLQGFWGLANPNQKDAPEGKMARFWSEQSGLPPKSEREAIASRLNALKKTIKTSTVAVYPVRVAGRSDLQLAERLAEMLTKQGFGRAEASNTDPKLQVQGNTNQTRILWDTARAFREFLHKNPPAADYALLADCGIGHSPEGKTVVGGVQFVLCDRKGDWVLVDLKNDHHPDFQRINPQSADDCNRLVAEALGKATETPSARAVSPKSSNPARDETLRQELLKRAREDQQARQEVVKYLQQHKGVDPEDFKNADLPLAVTTREIDRCNTARMKQIVDRYGWPGVGLVGKDGQQAAWLLVQHADLDLAFQKRCLLLITEAVNGGQAPAEHMAYLTDRVRVAEKQKQVYGTQFHRVSGRMEPYPIEDDAGVDSRRRSVGLPTLAEYRETLQKTYGDEPAAEPR
jgi:hypothetical protein